MVNLGNVAGIVISDNAPLEADGITEKKYVWWAKPISLIGNAATRQEAQAGIEYVLYYWNHQLGEWVTISPQNLIDDTDGPSSIKTFSKTKILALIAAVEAGSSPDYLARIIALEEDKADKSDTHTKSEVSALDTAVINLLRNGVDAEGDTLNKLYNLILGASGQVTKATIAERDAYAVKLGGQVFVTDDGDGKWALYKATTAGVSATYVKLSDPDLLNAVMSDAMIKTAYENNPDTNAFTDARLLALTTATSTIASLTSLVAEKQATLTDINFGAFTSGVGTKATQILADSFAFVDSVTGKWAKQTFTNLVAFLRGFFQKKVTTIYLAENTTLDASHESCILIITAFINLTVPAGLAGTFTTCVIDVKVGQCTMVQGAGATISGYYSLVLGSGEVSSLYKESAGTDLFRLK